ncbi:hypothetical protein ABPG75_003533 [Micractinium tetrahymenae]
MPSVTDTLPDEVLVAILAALPLLERHRTAAAVCRRWRQLCNSAPQLLRGIGASFADNPRGVGRLCPFCTWLLRHAPGRVERLSLEVLLAEDGLEGGTTKQEALWTTTAALAACGAAGALTGLQLLGWIGQPSVWAGGMCCLRWLRIHAWDREDVQLWSPPPGTLPCLQRLELAGDVCFEPSVHLPAGLTKLHLDCREQGMQEPLPVQLTTLKHLHTLSLEYGNVGLDFVARLPSLRRLSLLKSFSWPACTAELTGLEALVLDNSQVTVRDGASATAAVAAALPRLQRLTHLVLGWPERGGFSCPAELAAVSSLRSFAWLHPRGELPLGPWAARLQRLVTRADQLAGVAAALPAAAPRPQLLGVWCDECEPQQVESVLRCRTRLPAMQRVVLAGSEALFMRCLPALLAAQREAPHACIETLAGLEWQAFWCACGCESGCAPLSHEAFLAAE